MRLISQNNLFDIPYENTFIKINKSDDCYNIIGINIYNNYRYDLAFYKNKDNLDFVIDKMRINYIDKLSYFKFLTEEEITKLQNIKNIKI